MPSSRRSRRPVSDIRSVLCWIVWGLRLHHPLLLLLLPLLLPVAPVVHPNLLLVPAPRLCLSPFHLPSLLCLLGCPARHQSHSRHLSLGQHAATARSPLIAAPYRHWSRSHHPFPVQWETPAWSPSVPAPTHWSRFRHSSPGKRSPLPTVAAVVRPHCVSRALSSSGSLVHVPSPVVSQRFLVPHGGRSCSPGPSVAGVHGSSPLVAPGGQVGSQRSTSGSPSFLASPYGRFSVRLGSPSSGPDDCRCLVPQGEPSLHQLPCSGLGGFSASVVRSECHSDERQCHGCSQPEESGWHGLSGVVPHGVGHCSLD